MFGIDPYSSYPLKKTISLHGGHGQDFYTSPRESQHHHHNPYHVPKDTGHIVYDHKSYHQEGYPLKGYHSVSYGEKGHGHKSFVHKTLGYHHQGYDHSGYVSDSHSQKDHGFGDHKVRKNVFDQESSFKPHLYNEHKGYRHDDYKRPSQYKPVDHYEKPSYLPHKVAGEDSHKFSRKNGPHGHKSFIHRGYDNLGYEIKSYNHKGYDHKGYHLNKKHNHDSQKQDYTSYQQHGKPLYSSAPVHDITYEKSNPYYDHITHEYGVGIIGKL